MTRQPLLHEGLGAVRKVVECAITKSPSFTQWSVLHLHVYGASIGTADASGEPSLRFQTAHLMLTDNISDPLRLFYDRTQSNEARLRRYSYSALSGRISAPASTSTCLIVSSPTPQRAHSWVVLPLPADQTNDAQPRIHSTVDFMMGGTAAAISKTVAAPIERVKLLVQNQGAMLEAGRLDKPYQGPIV